MQDLRLHELGARRIHWRYDDPSGVPDLPVPTAGTAVPTPGAIRRVRRPAIPKVA